MTRFSLGLFLLTFAYTVAFVGCTPRSSGVSDETIAFDTITVFERHDAKETELSAACELSIRFVYPKNNSPLQSGLSMDSLRSLFIESVLGSQYTPFSPARATEEFKQDYLNNFDASIKDLATLLEEEELEERPSYTYYLTIQDSITFNDKHLLSFLVTSERYDGGAHGSHAVSGYVVNLQTGKLIKESDFEAINYKKNMGQVLQQKIAAKNEVSTPRELEDIGFFSAGEIFPNNNFTIDGKGITYYFNEYEIGAYYLGVTTIFIPFEELRLYCQPDSPLSVLMN